MSSGSLPKLKNFQNGAFVANPCRKRSWGNYSHDKLVGFDVTIHASTMMEACNVATCYWEQFKKYSPDMGHVNQFNSDIDPNHPAGDHWHPGLEGPHGGKPLILDPHGGTQDCNRDILIGPI